jgi:hypothetical protein
MFNECFPGTLNPRLRIDSDKTGSGEKVTVLAIKDRVLANNPLRVLHTPRNAFSPMNTKRDRQP